MGFIIAVAWASQPTASQRCEWLPDEGDRVLCIDSIVTPRREGHAQLWLLSRSRAYRCGRNGPARSNSSGG